LKLVRNAASALWRLLCALARLAQRALECAREKAPGLFFDAFERARKLHAQCCESQAWAKVKALFAVASEKTDKAFTAKETSPEDFLPGLLRLQKAPPSPLAKTVMRALLVLFGLLLAWAYFGSLDIVAVAEGKLIPNSYLKIVQPSDSGIVKEILVTEGQHVQAGQVLMRMDSVISDTDVKTLADEAQRKALALRRIDAELGEKEFVQELGESDNFFQEEKARAMANRAALDAALAEERTRLAKAKREFYAAREVRVKLADTLPQFVAQEKAYERLSQEGYAPSLLAGDKRRERIEREQELRTQGHLIESAKASVSQSERKLEQIVADFRRNLHVERNDLQTQLEKLRQELAKQTHKQGLLELKAPQSGTVKDLATHTEGTVVQPGTVVLTLIPDEELLKAEVFVSNQDRGFVRVGQKVRLKLRAFPFQKYGMLDGQVEQISLDATEQAGRTGLSGSEKAPAEAALSFRALVRLDAMKLKIDDETLPLSSGLQVSAEILIGKRTVLEYVLSPVRKAVHEAGREK